MPALAQIADALTYLCNRKVVHRDIAARNVLVSQAGIETVKLSDVGLSRPLEAAQYYRKTTKGKVRIDCCVVTLTRAVAGAGQVDGAREPA